MQDWKWLDCPVNAKCAVAETLVNSVDPDQTLQNAASDQCLINSSPRTQQFLQHNKPDR